MAITKLRGGLQVQPNSVTSDNIKDSTIMADDIANGSLDGAMFIDGSIPAEKLDTDLTLLQSFNGPNLLVLLDGAGALPVLDGSNLTGIAGSGTTNASDLDSGTLNDARLSVNVTLLGNTFNISDKLVKLTSDGKLPVLDGSNLTGIAAGGVTFVDEVAPSGAVNGSNMVFVLPSIPVAGSLSLYINGILQRAGAGNDYDVSSATVTLTWAPRAGSIILASYRL